MDGLLIGAAFVFLSQEKDQEAFRRRYFWAYDTPDGEGNNATSTKLLILPDGKMMSVERREQMDAACADRPKIGDDRPNQVRHVEFTRCQTAFGRPDSSPQRRARLLASLKSWGVDRSSGRSLLSFT